MNKKLPLLAAIAGILLAVNACYYDKKELLYPSSTKCTGTGAGFSTYVLPLIHTSCDQGSGCHGSGSSNGPGALTTYSQIQAAGAQILSSVEAGRMPRGSSLSSAQLQAIRCWYANGMQNN